MFRAVFRASMLSALLATAACSQEPARVDMRGNQYFGREGTSPVKQPSYVARQSAPVNNYAKSDYKPYQPAQIYTNTKPPAHISDRTEQSASLQSISSSDLPPPPANNWTKKSRSEESRAEYRAPVKEEKIAEVEIRKPAASAAKPQKFTSARETNSMMWPVNSHRVVSGFGPKGAGKANDGINIASAEGEPVWAAADGEVVYSGNELSSYGNMVLIKHPGNKTTTYAHMNRVTVDKYDRVKQGDIIGYVGSTGNVKSPQLHFAVRSGKDPVDPKKYLSTNVAGL